MAVLDSHTTRRTLIVIFAVIALSAVVWRALVEGHASMATLLQVVAFVLLLGSLVRLGWDRAS